MFDDEKGLVLLEGHSTNFLKKSEAAFTFYNDSTRTYFKKKKHVYIYFCCIFLNEYTFSLLSTVFFFTP